MSTLTHDEARHVYDRIGARQDSQSFYEDRATGELITHLELASALAVFEFGCGTGRFAADLLANHLPDSARYRAVDLSPRMIALATSRLAAYAPRVEVARSDGGPPVDEPSDSWDRFVSNFVFDLLSLDEIRGVLREAHRMLRPGGLLGISSLTAGFTPSSRLVSWVLSGVHALNPAWTGGCRGLALGELLHTGEWAIHHHARVSAFGVPMEVVVAAPVKP